MHETVTFLLVGLTLPNIHRFHIFFSHRLGNKPFLIWLLTASPHLKYADTIPSNLSLRAYFADINVSQGRYVARYARCGGIFDIRLTANLTGNLPVIFFKNWLRFDGIMVMSLWPRFLTHPVRRGVKSVLPSVEFPSPERGLEMSSRLDRTPTRDRQTDRQSRPRAISYWYRAGKIPCSIRANDVKWRITLDLAQCRSTVH